MKCAYVPIQKFKELELKVNELLAMHEMDSVLTREEKKLVKAAKADILAGRKDTFLSLDAL